MYSKWLKDYFVKIWEWLLLKFMQLYKVESQNMVDRETIHYFKHHLV